jgi:hypothetical protein
MIKTLYEFEVAIVYNDESTEPDRLSGCMLTYNDALERAVKMANILDGTIAPEKTIISIKKKVVYDEKDTN